MKNLLFSFSVFIGLIAFGQIDTSITLISKMDISPQFQLYDGSQIQLMGFTKLIGESIDLPGPTLVFEEGDSVEIKLWNFSQGANHTIHLHGLDVNQQNDGVPMLSFSVPHDSIGSYFMKAPHPGMYIYHCHETSALHVQAGMYGMLIIKPKNNSNLTWENGFEYAGETNWLFSEIDSKWHHDTIINHGPMPMHQHQLLDYNPEYFLINGRSNNQLSSNGVKITMGINSYHLVRLANIGNYGNKVFFPSELNAKIISSDGRILPHFEDSDSLEIFPGERYSVLLNSNQNFDGEIEVSYFNLNTGIVENTQLPGVLVDASIGIKVPSKEIAPIIFPNPTKLEFDIHAGFEIKSVLIFDAKGRQIKCHIKYDGYKAKIRFLNQKSGTFYLQILGEKNNLKKQIIKF